MYLYNDRVILSEDFKGIISERILIRPYSLDISLKRNLCSWNTSCPAIDINIGMGEFKVQYITVCLLYWYHWIDMYYFIRFHWVNKIFCLLQSLQLTWQKNLYHYYQRKVLCILNLNYFSYFTICVTGKKQIRLANAVVDGLTEGDTPTYDPVPAIPKTQEEDRYKKISLSITLSKFAIELFTREPQLVQFEYLKFRDIWIYFIDHF